MNQIIIRIAEERDIDPITQMDHLCFTVPWSRAAIAKEIQDNDLAFYVVAEAGNTLVGYAGLWGIVDEGHITNVAVHPNYRKRGIGEALVMAMQEHCRPQGITSYTLEVRPSNMAAIHLYEKLGFQVAGLRKKYYEDNGEDAIIMWLSE